MANEDFSRETVRESLTHKPIRYFYNGEEAKNVDVEIVNTGECLETRVAFEYVEPRAIVDRARFERLRAYVEAAEAWEPGHALSWNRWAKLRDALQPGDCDPLP